MMLFRTENSMHHDIRKFWPNVSVRILAGRTKSTNGSSKHIFNCQLRSSRHIGKKTETLRHCIGLALQNHFSGITIDPVISFFAQQEVDLTLDFNPVAT